MVALDGQEQGKQQPSARGIAGDNDAFWVGRPLPQPEVGVLDILECGRKRVLGGEAVIREEDAVWAAAASAPA